MPYHSLLISVDGGGTKTEICLFDELTNSKQLFRYGSSNYKTAGKDSVRKNIVDAIKEVCSINGFDLSEIKGIVMGLSGCDTPADMQFYKDELKKLDVEPEKILIKNDCEVAYLASTDEPGICVVAGTGSIAVGFGKNGEIVRCGGWGHLVSDGGSGFWIGRRIIRRFLKYTEGIAGYDPLFDKVKDFLEINNLDEAAYTVSLLNPTQIASLARLALDNAGTNTFCQELLQESTTEIVKITQRVLDKLGFNNQMRVNVVILGSLFNNELFLNSFQTMLSEKYDFSFNYIWLLDSPSENGISLAIKRFNH